MKILERKKLKKPPSEAAMKMQKRIETGDISIVREMEEGVKKGGKANENGFFTLTFYLVNHVSHKNRNEMVERLIKNICPVSIDLFSETVNDREKTILMCAIEKYYVKHEEKKYDIRNFELIKKILECGVNPNFETPNGNSSFKMVQNNSDIQKSDKILKMLNKYNKKFNIVENNKKGGKSIGSKNDSRELV